jgi:membrane associated rhomboid family serine protease
VREREPIFNAPAIVMAVLAAFVAVQLVRQYLFSFVSEAADDRLVQFLAFDPTRLGGGATVEPAAAAAQFVTHVFTHGNLAHLLINSGWFLAFATPVARRLGPLRFLAFFLLCGIGGALLYLPFNIAPMVGASGAISGLMGAAMRFLFVPLSQRDVEALAGDPERAPLMRLGAALSDRRILLLIAGWTALNVLFAWAAPIVLEETGIAWQAHLGGFFTGLFTFGWFDPKPTVHNNSAPVG